MHKFYDNRKHIVKFYDKQPYHITIRIITKRKGIHRNITVT